jgi:peroxiredoxin
MKINLLLMTTVLSGLLACSAVTGAELPVGADHVTPLAVGKRLPEVTVKTAEGQDFDLAAQTSGKPTVVIFYRGGWCPYCNLHLAQLQEAEPKLLALGYQILAISTDRPEDLHVTTDKHHLTYTLLSDRQMVAASAFHVAFKLPEAEREKYAKFNIDVPSIPNDPNGRWLPVPSVFIVNKQGEIKFVHSNPDFKKRISMPDLLAAAETAAQ